jgi:Tfp pilus assembly protein PilO
MNNKWFHHLFWLLSKLAQTLGIWGLLGVFMIGSSVVFYFTTVVTLDQQITTAQYQLDHASHQTTKAFNVSEHQTKTSVFDEAMFYKMFPSGSSLPKWLHSIDSIAIKQHLMLNHGDYRLSQTKQGQLLRYEIVLPVVGKYTQIRQFIAEALVELPALALSDMHIKRENTLSPTVEARLTFVLFLKGEVW